MKRLHFLVEGQTEATVAGSLLQPHFANLGWSVSFSIVKTSRPAGGATFKGGVGKWTKIQKEVSLLLEANFDILTTLFDYYGFPSDAPGMADRPAGDGYLRAQHVEGALATAVGNKTFVPHLVLHEFETWVLAAGDQLGDLLDDTRLAADLSDIVQKAGGVELVNDHPQGAPSKRLLRRCPEYRKTTDGPLVVHELGLRRLRDRCPHLDGWLRRIEAWPRP